MFFAFVNLVQRILPNWRSTQPVDQEVFAIEPNLSIYGVFRSLPRLHQELLIEQGYRLLRFRKGRTGVEFSQSSESDELEIPPLVVPLLHRLVDIRIVCREDDHRIWCDSAGQKFKMFTCSNSGHATFRVFAASIVCIEVCDNRVEIVNYYVCERSFSVKKIFRLVKSRKYLGEIKELPCSLRIFAKPIEALRTKSTRINGTPIYANIT